MDDVIRSSLAGIGCPLFVTEFGSGLYGLSTANSDTDHVCVFLPDIASQLLGGYDNPPNSFVYATKQDERAKNTSADVDIRFLSLQRLLRGLAIPEISSIDILYAWTNKSAISLDAGFEPVFARRAELLNLDSPVPFVEYGLGQIKKYGLRGTSLGIASAILSALREDETLTGKKLGDIFANLVKPHLPANSQFWNLEEIPAARAPSLPALRLFCALHPFNISAADFRQRVQGFYDKYGERAKKARENSGIDWKSASHAMRGLLNYCHLLEDGDISYPFAGSERELLLNIKLGHVPWREFERLFLERLSNVEARQPVNRYNPRAAREVILGFYGSCRQGDI